MNPNILIIFRICNEISVCTKKMGIFQSSAEPGRSVGHLAIFCIFCYGGAQGEIQQSSLTVGCIDVNKCNNCWSSEL